MRTVLALWVAALLTGSAAQAEPVQVAAFDAPAASAPAIKNLVSIAGVSDQVWGAELSYERLFSERWAARAFAEARNRGFFTNPNARRVGGGLGLRRYLFSPQPLAGVFFDAHLGAFNTFDPYTSTRFGAVDTVIHTLYGGGLTFGWQIPMADHVRLALSYRADLLYSDLGAAYFDHDGRLNGDLLLYLGYAF